MNDFIRPTRRGFLAGSAASLALLCSRPTHGQTTTQASDPKLAVFDELMTKFVHDHEPPGAVLAITYHGRLVYARAFGYANEETKERAMPTSLYRIASISKPFCATAVMRLAEKGKLKLDDKIFPILKLEPHLEEGEKFDQRWHAITVRHCLQHTGGWDRGKSFDPMGAGAAEATAKALKVPLPITPTQIIRYAMGKPLDSDPGTAYAYSNFGYCLLGRVIEAVSGKPFDTLVKDEVLTPLGIRDMRLGKNLFKDRAPHEVKYYDGASRRGRAISGPSIGSSVPLPYGVECIETMDANGGWIASAIDLVRFGAALDNPKKCPILSEASIDAMLAPPPAPVSRESDGKVKKDYYGCGWFIHREEGPPAKIVKSHSGLLAGSSTMLVCREGINWAAVFNCDADYRGTQYAAMIRPPVTQAIANIKDWPDINMFRSQRER